MGNSTGVAVGGAAVSGVLKVALLKGERKSGGGRCVSCGGDFGAEGLGSASAAPEPWSATSSLSMGSSGTSGTSSPSLQVSSCHPPPCAAVQAALPLLQAASAIQARQSFAPHPWSVTPHHCARRGCPEPRGCLYGSQELEACCLRQPPAQPSEKPCQFLALAFSAARFLRRSLLFSLTMVDQRPPRPR